ncbi:MAG TPA: cytochrome P450 [Dehalococcoidia bacterium]|nr:cytochrome P450 [Dehalococcoidia bacterium]
MLDVFDIAQDHERFSSRSITVTPVPHEQAAAADYGIKALPISVDPPVHTWSRKLLLPAFNLQSMQKWEPVTRDLCRSLVDGFVNAGRADAAAGYAQQIPVRVIAGMLGIPADMSDTFTDWVRGVLEIGLTNPEVRIASRAKIIGFFRECIAERRINPGDDLISEMLAAEVDGAPVADDDIIGICTLLLVAGIDTTWSAIGSSLWHLATHADDRHRLAADPTLMGTAVEELLRAYAPVTMARIVAEDTEVAGCPMKAGDRILMAFPAANRDPEKFPDADKILLDRQKNAHIAFGVGIHRCVGSNLARMEVRVALEEWMSRIPDFWIEDSNDVTWAGGQVRGPRSCVVVFPAA